MSWSKRQIITQALEEIGIASYTFDVEPDETQSALRRLDAMVAAWNAQGIQLGYPLVSDYMASDLDDATAFPDWAVESATLGLAVRLAPSYGKQVSPDTKFNYGAALRAMYMRTAKPTTTMGWPHGLPAGAGHKMWRDYDNPFLTKNSPEIEESPGNQVRIE